MDDPRAMTVPAIREWSAGGAGSAVGGASRVLFAAPELAASARLLVEEIETRTGVRLQPVDGPAVPTPGDIQLRLDPTLELPAGEGYVLRIDSTVTITAPTRAGVWFGTRTLLQLLGQDLTLPGGIACDWPSYPERGVMVDVGRKYFTMDWLRSYIREMSYLKLNYLHLHLTDSLGFRVESATHPEVVSEQHYSKRELLSLADLAHDYGITVVPEFDMPGHLDHVLRAHPELRLVDVDGVPAPDKIDLTKDAAYALLADLLDELVPLFPGPYFHIGADEYLEPEEYPRYPQLAAYARRRYGSGADAKDTYLGFINWANRIVRGHRKIARAWTDGMYGGSAVTVDTDIVAEHWINIGPGPKDLFEAGHQVTNGNIHRLYYTLGTRRAPDPRYLYETFAPSMFDGTQIETGHPAHLGAKLHIWELFADDETEGDVARALHHTLRSFAQSTWGGPDSRAVKTWEEFVPVTHAVGRAPGNTIAMPPSVAHRCPVTTSAEHSAHPGRHAVDGDPATYWQSAPLRDQWLCVDLGQSTRLSRVTVHWRNPPTCPYRLEVSDDEVTWSELCEASRFSRFHILDPIDGEGRFLRLSITEPATNGGCQLYDLAVYAG